MVAVVVVVVVAVAVIAVSVGWPFIAAGVPAAVDVDNSACSPDTDSVIDVDRDPNEADGLLLVGLRLLAPPFVLSLSTVNNFWLLVRGWVWLSNEGREGSIGLGY